MKIIKSLIITAVACISLYIPLFNNIDVNAYDTAPRIISGEIYHIKNKNSGQYLDVSDAVDQNYQNVQQWRKNNSDAQRWQVVHEGNGIYKIVSQVGSKTRVLDVSSNDNNNESNIDIYGDASAPDRRFRIVLNSDGYSYRMLSQCSNFSKGVTVAGASLSPGQNVFQYTYNGTYNDEWIFEPVFNYSVELAVNYARTNWDRIVPTYPDINGLGGDCANFVSQCMLAGGVHYQDTWWIEKLNNSHPRPNNSSELDDSWSLANPSPWISAVEFNEFWSSRVVTTDYLGSYITSHSDEVFFQNYFAGDVVQILSKNIWGNPGKAEHTMFMTGYGSYNNQMSFLLTYHSGSTKDKNLLQIAESNPNRYFRFFKII